MARDSIQQLKKDWDGINEEEKYKLDVAGGTSFPVGYDMNSEFVDTSSEQLI